MHNGFAGTLLSLAAIAVFLLLIGSFRLYRRGERTKALLMLVAALVLLANLFILSWTPPR